MIRLIEDSSKEREEVRVKYTLHHYQEFGDSDKHPFINFDFPDTLRNRRHATDAARHEMYRTLSRHSAVGICSEVSPELVHDSLTYSRYRLECIMEHEVYVPPIRRTEDSIEGRAYLLVMEMWGDLFAIRNWQMLDFDLMPYYGYSDHGFTWFPEQE